jgi:hypothetical protein
MFWLRLVPISATIAAIAGGLVFALAAPVSTTMSASGGTTQTSPRPPLSTDSDPWNG